MERIYTVKKAWTSINFLNYYQIYELAATTNRLGLRKNLFFSYRVVRSWNDLTQHYSKLSIDNAFKNRQVRLKLARLWALKKLGIRAAAGADLTLRTCSIHKHVAYKQRVRCGQTTHSTNWTNSIGTAGREETVARDSTRVHGVDLGYVRGIDATRVCSHARCAELLVSIGFRITFASLITTLTGKKTKTC